MPTYETAKADLNRRVNEAMQRYHPKLHEQGVRVDTLVAHATVNEQTGEPVGVSIRHHGRKAYAKIRIVGLKDRVAGRGDAELIIDGDEVVKQWNDSRLNALIDHELTHLELQVDKEGGAKTDDAGRPKLRMRLHDREFGWFDCVAKRHPRYAIEVAQAAEMFGDLEFKQLYLRGFEEEERPILKADKESKGSSRKAAASMSS